MVRIQNKRKVREIYKEDFRSSFQREETDVLIRGKWERKEIIVTSQDRNKGMKELSYKSSGGGGMKLDLKKEQT